MRTTASFALVFPRIRLLSGRHSWWFLVECLFLARFCHERRGRACLLCPSSSDVDLFRYRQRIIYLDAKVSDGAFNLRVAEQELDST